MNDRADSTQPAWRERAAKTRKRNSEVAVIGAAWALAQENSFEDVSVDEIAAHANVRTSTIYSRFGSKAGLAAAMLGPSFSAVIEAARRDLTDAVAAPKAIENFLGRVGSTVDENRGVATVFFAGLAKGPHHKLSGQHDNLRASTLDVPRMLGEVLAAGVATGEIAIDGEAFETARMILNFFVARYLTQNEPGSQSAALVGRIVLRGIEARR